jgi:hypothetical protein
MAYCGPKGIPLSRFLSWSETDQDAALAWQAHENRRCSGCGTHPDDWDDAKNGLPSGYHAEAHTCPGCAETQRMTESDRVQNGGRGVHVRLVRGGYADCERCGPRPRR